MPEPLPDLHGQVCLIADAGTPVGEELRQYFLDAGATVIALRHRSDITGGTRQSDRATDISVVADLENPQHIAGALVWATTRTQRLDLAVILGSQIRSSARIALAGLTAGQLGLTARFQGSRTNLMYLTPSEASVVPSLRAALRAVPFADRISATVVDAWPDTDRSALAAVVQILGTPADSDAVRRFDPLKAPIGRRGRMARFKSWKV